MQDIYRLRKIVKQEEAARSTSRLTDGDQPNYEHSEGSPIKKEEEEEPTIQPEDASETGPGSTTEVDEDLDDLDDSEQCEYADTGILTSPPPCSAIPRQFTAGAAAGMEIATSPVVPATKMEPTVSPASSMAPAISPVVPATRATHHIAPPPPVPPSHDMPGQWFMPPPVVISLAHPPYQMTLYPLYPVYLPLPTR